MKQKRSIETPLILALDIGSSSVRSSLFDRTGCKLSDTEAVISHQVATTKGGGAELSADEIIDNLLSCIERTCYLAGSLSNQIAGVGVCTFWHSFLGVDRSNRAVTPIYMWSDLRAWNQALKLRNHLSEFEVHQRTGCVIHPCYLPAKILWLKEVHPDLFRICHKFVSIGEYLFLRLFGDAACSLSMASGTGLFDQDKLIWDERIMEVLGISSDKFLPIVDVDVPQFGVRKELGERLRGLKEAFWFPALGDGACSNVGSGCIDISRIALMVGTSGAMRVVCENRKAQAPWGLWSYRLDRRRFLIGGALSNGGSVHAWLKNSLKFDIDSAQIESELEKMKPDGHGLTILPFFAGERNPDWPLDATAVVVGLRSHSRPIDILRAAYESVAYRFAMIYDLLSKAVPEAEEVVISGGITNSKVWVQIIADVLGRIVIESGESEASSRGAAVMALLSLGVIEELKAVPVILGSSYEPNLKYHEKYLVGLERHRKLYKRFLSDWYSPDGN